MQNGRKVRLCRCRGCPASDVALQRSVKGGGRAHGGSVHEAHIDASCVGHPNRILVDERHLVIGYQVGQFFRCFRTKLLPTLS